MAALIEALEQDPARARRRWALGAGVAVLVGAAAVTLVRGPGRAEALCRGGPARLAGVWEPAGAAGAARPRRDAIEAAFRRAGGADGAAAWARVEPLLDRYATSWLGMYRDACEATHTRGEQSPETLDLRMDCLDERRAALGALTTVLAAADGAALASAVDAANGLPPVDGCADIRLLREGTDAPRDEATRAKIADLRARLAAAKTLAAMGRYDEANAEGRAVIAEARALGNRGLLAQALGTVAWFGSGTMFHPEILPLLEESVWTALAVKRDDVAAQSATYLQSAVGYYLARPDEGRRWGALATALLDRLGPGHDVLRSWVVNGEGAMRGQEGDFAGALDAFERALALKQKALPPDHPDVGLGIDNVGDALHRLGRNDEALAMNQRAAEIARKAYGPASPELARETNNRGECLLALGRAREALAAYEDARDHWGSADTESPTLAFPLTGIGESLLALGRPREALEPLEHALRLRDAAAVDPMLLAQTRFALARALADAGGAEGRALSLARQARAAYAAAAKAIGARERDKVDAWLARRD